ncbi:Na+/H+ antiporter [Streptomyces liangshanensis]|uniref:Na+/H+ antiporter n=1 Tax=Streptomyces liangshanensis TaxID=2717324 RepID=A0A6G9H7V0_9ACTN|nr:Na+/H+ antiporter [Streptomyces liangshanensis]QIQ06177.1 Na+/H+ antiporter [Streptomyces liangshanensis]
MEGLEIAVVLVTAVLLLTWVANRLRVSEPVALLVGGVLIGLVPEFRSVHLSSDLILLIFLPPLLYAESLKISLHQILANLRVIVLLSVGLVLLTAFTVAATAHGFGMAWPLAFVLGAVLAPTDATAVASVARGMPRRTLTTMRAESLVNDGTALAVFAVAVEIATGEHSFQWGGAILRFVLSYVGGAAIGAAVALLVIGVRRRVHDTAIESGLSVLTPFAVYVPAELADVSGVLAVVVCGLILSRQSPLLMPASSRIQSMAFWQVTTFLLNGSLFVLVGLQLPDVIGSLPTLGHGDTVALAAAVTGAVIVTRLAYLYTTPYLIRAVDRRPQQRARRIGARQRMPVAWGGVRGGVSLAAALAVPILASDGTRLADRDVIVFVTAVVIVATLLLQGQTLPAVIRWSRLPPDPTEAGEELLARQEMTAGALEALRERAAWCGATPEVERRLAAELGSYAESLRTVEPPAHHTELRLRQELIRVKRTRLVALRDAGRIDDAVLRRVQETLDSEDTRLDLRIAEGQATAGGLRSRGEPEGDA